MDWLLYGLTALFLGLAGFLAYAHWPTRIPRPRPMNLPKYEKKAIPGRPEPVRGVTDTAGGPPLQRFQPDRPEMDITPISPFSSENVQENSKNDEN